MCNIVDSINELRRSIKEDAEWEKWRKEIILEGQKVFVETLVVRLAKVIENTPRN